MCSKEAETTRRVSLIQPSHFYRQPVLHPSRDTLMGSGCASLASVPVPPCILQDIRTHLLGEPVVHIPLNLGAAALTHFATAVAQVPPHYIRVLPIARLIIRDATHPLLEGCGFQADPLQEFRRGDLRCRQRAVQVEGAEIGEQRQRHDRYN